MTVTEYKNIIAENGFEEYPILNDGTGLVSRFMNFSEADIDLKIYLNKLILCRSYYGIYTAWYPDVEWFAKNFFREMKRDFIKPELSETIKFAAGMILADEPFTKGIIGTTFMFGVIEFYAKYKIGFRPLEYNFFDKKGKKEYLKQLDLQNKNMDLSIKPAFEQLQRKELPISLALNEIDAYTISRLSSAGINSENWTVHTIAERLNLARNPMLHGETHSFYSTGAYLLLLYSLFHLYDTKESELQN
jgi:hypothetical protein